jgi:hypothetical protein
MTCGSEQNVSNIDLVLLQHLFSKLQCHIIECRFRKSMEIVFPFECSPVAYGKRRVSSKRRSLGGFKTVSLRTSTAYHFTFREP